MSYHQISRPELGIRREWQFPLPQMRTLDNGMTIWAYQLPGPVSYTHLDVYKRQTEHRAPVE